MCALAELNLVTVHSPFLQDSVKWIPKSPKLHGSHNWNSQGSHRASLKGKENTQGCGLYKFSSTNDKWKEGRISPEQEAEELEDPEEDVSFTLELSPSENILSLKEIFYFYMGCTPCGTTLIPARI